MKKFAIGLSLAAMAIGGVAYAKHDMGARHDTNGDGMISRAEMEAHSAQMFARMDVNSDGKVDQADRQARWDKRFDTMDTDRNGQLSRAEFAAAHAAMGHGRGMGHGQGMNHGEGMDHGKGMGGGHGKGRHGGMMMGRMADANGDGTITKAEFTAATAKHFETMDANRDGSVSAEEHQAARKAMRDKMRGHHMNRAGTPPASPPAQ